MDYWNAFCALVVIYIGYILVRNYRRYYERLENIRQKRVAVTGCDTGFGKLLVEHLDKIGVITYAGCLLQSSVDQFNEKHKNIKAFQLDITSEESVDRAAKFIKKDLNGRALWAIVNNAGIASYLPIEWESRSRLRKVLEVNVVGGIDFTNKLLGLLKKGKEGRVVNMTSILGRIAAVGCAYTVSKYAAEGFSDSLSYDMDPFNITVHVIEPSFFRTNIFGSDAERDGLFSKHFETLSDELKASYGKAFSKKRDENTFRIYNELSSEKFEDLIDAYDHALFAKYPKSRYHVNNDTKFVYVPVSFLPVPRQMKIMKFVRWLIKNETPPPAQAVK